MFMYNILVADAISDFGLQQLSDAKDMKVVKKTGLSEAELIEIIGEYDALLVRSQTRVTANVLAAATNLKVVGRAGVGVDNIDLEAATERGVIVINAPDGNTVSTAEHTFAMIMAVARSIPQSHKKTTSGEWDRKSFVGVELRNKTLGVIGMGRIGSEVAKRGKAFGMDIVAFDPFLSEERANKLGVKLASVPDVVKQADFITVHTPLTKETHHLIGQKEFELMKKGVRIINCARGGIIDEKALYDAIISGKVAAAGLDVFEVEPPVDNPLLALPQVVVTPHLGASTIEAQENVAVDVSEEVIHILRSEPFKNAVNLPPVPADLLAKLQPYFTLGEKLGLFLSQVTVGAVQKITVIYSGDLAEVDTAPLTRNVVKGVLSYHLGHEVNIVNSMHLAKVRDIEIIIQKSTLSKGFTNLITVSVQTNREEKSVSGTLLNGYGARVVKVDQFPIDVAPEGHLLLVSHTDRPGVIGRVGTVLGSNDVNIATMQVGRKIIGGSAIMMLTVDKPVPPHVLDSFGELQEINSVTQIDL
jgi:D-3-phosphoglycerate dehydrogenase